MRIFFLLAVPLHAQPPIGEIMPKVAANLARAAQARAGYVYTEKQLTRIIRTDRKLDCEERREYTVAPSPDGATRTLIHRNGQYREGKRLHPYTTFEERCAVTIQVNGMNIDSRSPNATAGNKDGIDMNLFPFLPKDLPNYEFHFLASVTHRGRPAYRIAFAALEEATFDHPWAGEALIDAEDLHPIQIETKLAPKLPLAVRALLGTNLKQTGFTVSYARLAPGLWFPSSYGTEFHIGLLFFYKRIISMSMEASDFRRTAADSSVSFAPLP